MKLFYQFTWLLILGLTAQLATAQCNPQGPSNGCTGEVLCFKANSPGYSTSVTWDFGNGLTSTKLDPCYSYPSPGNYTVTFKGNGGAGSCNRTLTVVVKPSPTINVKLQNSSTQCFKENTFCFVDSSSTISGNTIVRMTYLFSDGNRIDTLNPVFPVNFCKSLNDPRGATISLEVEAETANGCVITKNYNDFISVYPKIGAEFNNITPAPNPGCDSTLGRFKNLSKINLADVAEFCWNWGDGQTICGDSVTNTVYWHGPNNDFILDHLYRVNGTFDVSLYIKSKTGCIDVFTWKAAVSVVNLSPKPEILLSKKVFLDSENPIQFSIKNKPSSVSKFLWIFGDPATGPDDFEQTNLFPKHTFSGLGPFQISLSVVSGPCDITLNDTIQIVGPKAQIEIPYNQIAFDEKYQCTTKDSIHFTNNSTFYQNDSNKLDEDSIVLVGGKSQFAFSARDGSSLASAQHKANRTMGNQVWRVWDFGDEFAQNCTTSTSKGINVGVNCNYSTDEFPVHKYQNWDSVYYNNYYLTNDSFCELIFNEASKTCTQGYIDTTRKGLHRSLFYKNVAHNYTATLWLNDTINKVESIDKVDIILTKPDASKLAITSGTACPQTGGNNAYYLNFDMNTGGQSYFAVNFDSLADATNFIPFNSGGVLAPPTPGSPYPFVLPYSITGNYPDKFVKGYTPGEIGNIVRTPEGSFTLGLIVGNGPLGVSGSAPACVDTVWYHNMFQIQNLNAKFDIVSPQANTKTICAGESAYFKIDQPIQHNISTLRWNWGNQGIGKGPYSDNYIEEFKYMQKYVGPSPTRNDKDISYNGENWYFNYVIRQTYDDFSGIQVIDTIVTSIIKDWKTTWENSDNNVIIDATNNVYGDCYLNLPKEEMYKLWGNGTFGCIDTTGLGTSAELKLEEYRNFAGDQTYIIGNKRYRYTNSSQTDSIEVAHILHFRDSSLQGFDTLVIGNDTTFGVWKKEYVYKELSANGDTLLKKQNGPMFPSLYLSHKNGCESNHAAPLNVGFLNEFRVEPQIIANGLIVRLEDSLRYWQYDEQDPPTYPIFPYNFWFDFKRYTNNQETFEADWDSTDGLGPIWERSLSLNHIYDNPGNYIITVVTKDSMNCRDTARINVAVTKTKADFANEFKFINCTTYFDFYDSTKIENDCNGGTCDEIIKYNWDFGDGSRQSLLKNPSHYYTLGGYYDVKLKVWTRFGGIDSITKQIYVPGPRPQFEFEKSVWNNSDSALICKGDVIELINTSGGEKIDPAYEMRWGDGSKSNPGDSSSTNGPKYNHKYDSAGTFELYLVQFDKIAGGNVRCSRIFPDTNPDLITKRKIIVKVIDSPQLSFTMSKDTVCKNESINFTYTGSPIYDYVYWDFGNGTGNGKNGPNFSDQHVFTGLTGDRKVTLNGEYTPQLNYPHCPDSFEDWVFVKECTLNTSNLTLNMAVYPNPSTGQFTLVVSEGTNVKDITLFDILGAEHQITWKRLNETSFAIEASQIAPATYFAKIETDFGTMTEKVVVMGE